MKVSHFILCRLIVLLSAFNLSVGFADVQFLEENIPVEIRPYFIRTWQVSDGLPFDQVRDVLQRGNGFLWIATINGAARFDGTSFERFNLRTAPGLANNRISKLYEDKSGVLFLGHDSGHVSIRRESLFVPVTPPQELTDDPVVDFAEGANATVWAKYRSGKWLLIGQNGRPVFTGRPTNSSPPGKIIHGKSNGWCEQDGHVVQVLGGRVLNDWGPVPWGIKNQEVYFIELANGDIAAGMTFGGLYILYRKGGFIRLNTGGGLASNTILCLQEDREGTLWLGTTAGLQSFRFNRYSGIREGSAYQYMTAITARKSGGIWFGTNRETLHAVENERERQVNKPPVPKGGIRVMLEDHEGVLWVNVDNGFLLCLDQNGYKNVFPVGEERDDIWALYEDEQDTVWAGGEKGLWRKDSTGWHLVASEKNGIANIRCIEGDQNGTLWIGMESDGLACFQNGEFKRISPEKNISTDYITTLHFDQDEQTLWIGTCGNGLLRLRDGQITTTVLPQHTVTQIIDDGLGRLWFVTEEGVAVVEKKLFQNVTDGRETPVPIMIDKNEGVNPTVQIDAGVATACRDTIGNIWIICGKKLLTFRPEQIKRCTDSVQMLIRNVVINDGMTYAVNGRSLITLPPSVQRMDINFSAFSYFAPSHINFRCRMIGLDSAWVDLGSRRFSSYQHVKPGKYEFEVIASNRDGLWNPTPEVLQITVQPHIWETWWFKTGLYIGGTVLIVVFSLGVAERITRRKLILTEKQHAVEQERTRIAMDLHDEIGSELTRLSMLSHRVARAFKRHELNRVPTQVTEMESAARKLVCTLDEIVWVVSPINDTLDNLIAYISKYVSEFLHEAGIPCETDIPIELPNYQISGSIRHNIFLAVKAAISNAAKHSNATQITLRVEMLSEMVQITLVDNGKGLTDPEDRRFQNGLKNMRKRMTLVGGGISICNNNDKGTTVKFIIPLKR